MDRKTHVRFSGGCARATAHGYPTKETVAPMNWIPYNGHSIRVVVQAIVVIHSVKFQSSSLVRLLRSVAIVHHARFKYASSSDSGNGRLNK